jgi:hypothetical protein
VLFFPGGGDQAKLLRVHRLILDVKGPTHQLELGTRGENDGDDIAADAFPGGVGLAGVGAGHAAEMGSLVIADGAFRRTEFVALARFHFDDDESVAVPGDQISFAIGGGQAIVAGDDDVAGAAQKAVRQVLTAAAKSQIRNPAPPACI